jgi:ribonuclease Z
LKLTILGTGSATPSLIRHPSAQILSHENSIYLIDCGEGTQLQLLKHGIKISKLKYIFISHLHGDHYFGLIGLISSLNLARRRESLTVFGPKGLDEILTIQLKYSDTQLHFKLDFVSIDTNTTNSILETSTLKVTTIPLKHRIPCSGFLFETKRAVRNIIKSKIPIGISHLEIIQLKNGEDVYFSDGKIKYKMKQMTFIKHDIQKYAYCSDTIYDEKIIEQIRNVDLLYHEATFKNDLVERAHTTYHSTAEQAAIIAQKAEVTKLLIGHFSSRYHDLSENLQEALPFFNNTEIALEGNEYEI